jgi:hypothetical protein
MKGIRGKAVAVAVGGVPVNVGVNVGVFVGVRVGVREAVTLAVGVRVGPTGVADGVEVAVSSGVGVSDGVAVATGVAEGVIVGVSTAVGVGVAEGVAVGVAEGRLVGVFVGVRVGLAVGKAQQTSRYTDVVRASSVEPARCRMPICKDPMSSHCHAKLVCGFSGYSVVNAAYDAGRGVVIPANTVSVPVILSNVFTAVDGPPSRARLTVCTRTERIGSARGATASML